MSVQNGDFVELDYTGRVKDGQVFDSSIAEVAKENRIFSEKADYTPVIICVGEKQLVKGLDSRIVGMALGRHVIELSPDEAFGRRSSRMIQLIATSKFAKQGVMPEPGMQLVVDNLIGTVRSVAGGRTVVDFNHPLAGKGITYEIDIKRKVEDSAEKANALLKLEFGVKDAGFKDGKVVITAPVAESLRKRIVERLKSLAGVKEVEFYSAKA